MVTLTLVHGTVRGVGWAFAGFHLDVLRACARWNDRAFFFFSFPRSMSHVFALPHHAAGGAKKSNWNSILPSP